ncbi:MAG: DUF429 domain-containing protein [Methylobacterium mesophilicum]|nr:DUF429 domain-containing protein [Methylobacterium mesophilicum]
MIIRGIDFTSRPTRRKPITCAEGWLDGPALRVKPVIEWESFEGFEKVLRGPGPWIAGLDFPFSQARRFVEGVGWPQSWAELIAHVGAMSRPAFRTALEAYRLSQPMGRREHRRETDRQAKSISPQKLYGVPVALMFFEGAPRLLASGVTIPGLVEGDPGRVAVEAYPGVLARHLIGRRSYKNDDPRRQTPDQHRARQQILACLCEGALLPTHGVIVEADPSFADDPTGDTLDALLCAVQAAWSWRERDRAFGMPDGFDPLEGWIAEPTLGSRG